MNTFSHVPPGFRFRPSDEELVDYYLRKKTVSAKIDLDVIKDVDLYRIEPWDIQELCSLGTEEEDEWYFFSHKDKKYPSGTRTNRATKSGFWKATGRDKAIYARHCLVGMRKTLVFYQGRAPKGLKSDWILHEYRLETNENGPPQEEGWVVCRVFKKRKTTVKRMSDYMDSPCWHDHDQVSFMPELDSSQQNYASCHFQYLCKQEEIDSQCKTHHDDDHHDYFLQPGAASASCNTSGYVIDHTNLGSSSTLQPSMLTQDQIQHQHQHQHQNHLITIMNDSLYEQDVDQVTDWRVLDKFVASQLSLEDDSNETNELGRPEIEQEYAASTLAFGDPWK